MRHGRVKRMVHAFTLLRDEKLEQRNVNADLKNLLIIIRPHALQSLPDLTRIPTDMLAIPAIAAPIVVGKRSLEPFQAHVRAAEDSLTHVVEAVDHVPVVVFGHRGDVPQRVVRGHGGVDFDDGEEAVQLMRHGCSENGCVGPHDGRGEIMVVLWVRDRLEAHTLCDAISVPSR